MRILMNFIKTRGVRTQIKLCAWKEVAAAALRPRSRRFCVASVALGVRQGTFGWQAWHLVTVMVFLQFFHTQNCRTIPSHTAMSHTQQCHLQQCHTQLCHTQLSQTQFFHKQLCQTQAFHTHIHMINMHQYTFSITSCSLPMPSTTVSLYIAVYAILSGNPYSSHSDIDGCRCLQSVFQTHVLIIIFSFPNMYTFLMGGERN